MPQVCVKAAFSLTWTSADVAFGVAPYVWASFSLGLVA